MPQREGTHAERMNYPLAYLHHSAFYELDETYSHWGGQPAFLSLLIQMLISSRNAFTEILRIMFKQISGQPMA